MIALARGQTTGPTSPRLVFFAARAGVLLDLAALEFAVWDLSDDAKKLDPEMVVDWTAVDLETEALGTGRYAPEWTVDEEQNTGEHEVRWRWKFDDADDWTTAQQPFEVIVAGDIRWPHYCLLADLRDEGLTASQLNDARALLAIRRASQFIERVTGRFFEPRYLEAKFDGRGRGVLPLSMPIVGIETINFETSPFFPSSLPVEADMWRAYARHLAGTVDPDDREDPKIELFSASEDMAGLRPFSLSRLIFPRGQQNIYVNGVFGYTEADGTPMGGCPALLRRVCQLLVFRDYAKLSQKDSREDAQRRHRIISESTRDQSYSLSPSQLGGAITGDPEIDQLLVSFVRPPAIGAA